MSSEKIIEPPGKETAGLASGTQIVDVTTSIRFATSSTSCSPPEHLVPVIVTETKPEELLLPDFDVYSHRKLVFKRTVRESIRKNADILKELAKY